MTPAEEAKSELSAMQLIPAAMAAGALSARNVVHDGVRIDQVGRSHPVYRVSIGEHPRFFVKVFGPRRNATDGLPEREWALQTLARERPAVASLVPRPWPWKTNVGPYVRARVVVSAAEAGAEAFRLDEAEDSSPRASAWAEVVEALVPPLAALHRATRDLARADAKLPGCLKPVCPWGLSLMDADAVPELWSGPVTGALLRDGAADAAFVAALRDTRSLWRPITLIHADLKHDNLLVERDASGARVRVLDWEMARIGDPAWDLASLAARLASMRTDGPPWPQADIETVSLLVQRYAAASGLSVPPLARRVIAYAGAFLLMMSLQHASTLPPGSDLAGARTLLLKARSTLHRVDRLSEDLIATSRNVSSA